MQPISSLRRASAILLCLVWSLVLGPWASGAATAPPNVILVITDDQGYGDIGAHGNTMIRTPNLDRLHSQSVRLANYHVDPTCAPTRSALMTGRYSTRTGCWHTIMGRSLMFHDEVTLADALSANGYRTAMYGKWHLGDNHPMRPQDRGFQEVLNHGGGGVGQTPDFWGNDYFDDTYHHNGKPETFEGYCTDVFFSNALKFIEANRTRPFFVYLATNVPHGPYNVDERYSKPYLEKGVPQPMANFYGMIQNMDENLGRMMAKVKEWGLEENTIFIFTTDNGTAAGVARAGGGKGKNKGKGNVAATDATWAGFNAGMRGQKGSQYDGGHRVPFFIKWPKGGIGGGKDVNTLVAHVDILPTLIELTGVKFTPKNDLDGRSLAPLLKGNTANWPDRTLFAHTQREEIPPKWVRSTAMTQRWRLVDGKELYDMDSDPGQTKDVSAQHADVVAKLRGDYEKWWTGLEPSFSKYGYITIGSDRENPTLITCHDWHAEQKDVPWNHEMIKRAPWSNGYWMIEVAKAGKYEFTLRQQPEVARHPIEATKARIKVGAVEDSGAVPPGADGVKLTLNLKPGHQRLETWLTDETSGNVRGAFFIDVRRGD